MNRETKKELVGAGLKVGSNLIVRIILRRAAKGGRFAKRLVNFFGLHSGEQIEDFVTPIANRALDRKRKK